MIQNVVTGVCVCVCILKHNQQDATYTIFFIVVSALHVSSGFSAHHQELKNCRAVSDTCQTFLLLPLLWVSSDLPTLAVTAHKFDKYTMLRVQFLSS